MANIELLPLEQTDREQFIKDNQAAFNYGALEEFGRRDDHFEEEGEIIGAFLCFDIDCDAGLEFHGEVVVEDGDLLDEFFDQSLIKLCDVGFLPAMKSCSSLIRFMASSRWWLSSSDCSFWSRSRKISSAMAS
jgi:hypothetical protein